MFRTDENNNPTAFTTKIAAQAKLIYGVDYVNGTPFPTMDLVTARLLGDPIEITKRVIDSIGYRTSVGIPRWTYICLPQFVWNGLTEDQKRDVIGYHYRNEGGVTMKGLFPNYGAS